MDYGGIGSYSIQIGDYTLTNNGSYDGMIIKYDAKGEVEWARSIGGSSNEFIYSVAETNDGGYIAGGYFNSNSIQVGDYTLNSNGGNDGMIIKYDAEGEVEWARSVGGSKSDDIQSVATTENGGYIAGGYFNSNSIQVGDYTLNSNGGNDGMIIKYASSGEVEWARSVGGSIGADSIYSVASTSDGGVIVGGDFTSSKIQVGEYTLTNRGKSDGMVIKYDASGEVEWAKAIGGDEGDEIHSVAITEDGGYIAGGYFSSSSIQIGEYTLTNNSSSTSFSDGMIIKYASSGEVEWAKGIGGTSEDRIQSVATTEDGEYIAGGDFNSTSIEVDGKTLTNNGGADGMILEIVNQTGVPEVQELTVENTRKEFKITTDVNEIDGIKGGEISGEDKNPYETVKYGDANVKEIIMTPDENYEIIGITVNGEEWPFEENDDGTYTMPQFNNVTEDKHIEVTYALKDNKLTINKVDSETQEPLQGATFKLDQIEERTEPDNEEIIGEIVANGETYYEANTENEITEQVVGELTNNGTYYFVQNEDGTLTPTNSKTYQVANGGSTGKQNTTANSYVEIDLSNLEGQYVAVVNAQVNSESADYGYATISQTTTAPSYSTNNSNQTRFMYISGTSSSVTKPTDYTSKLLEGGNVYYLHLGYRKDISVDTNDDQVVINSIKVYGANSSTYNFVENGEGGYESNNQGIDNTTANSYIPIDLTDLTGKYNLTVNAQVSSQTSDYGYATVTSSTDRVSYSTNSTSAVRFVYISGEQEAQDYTTVLQGGQMYYVHLGYYKNASTSSGDDKFTVNSIEVTLNSSDLYHPIEVTTNSEGQAITQIPFGRYQITEIKAPERYEILEKPIIVDFKADGNTILKNENDVNVTINELGEFVIENKESAKVIVHHYLKNNDGEYTTEKVAEDELLEGKIGEGYTTSPHLDLEKYVLEKDENGSYVIPENATGTYASGTIEITYYYEEKEIPLTVHHYIEGTTTPVPLKDGGVAEEVTDSGKEGTTYQTNEIEDSLLSDAYEIAEVPENAEGTYRGEEVIVTYYYKLVERPVTIVKTGEDGEVLEGVKFEIATKKEQIQGEEEQSEEILGTYTTNQEGKITITLPAGEYIAREIEVPEGYEIPTNPETEFTVTKAKETITVNITNTKKQGEVIVHHYIEGTEEKVPSNVKGQVVEDVVQTGKVGDMYATKQAENIANNYEYVSSTNNISGEIVEGTTEVIYYYRLKEPVIETPEITKESSIEKVTDINQVMDYSINYQATIDTYIGKATVTVVDYLPYEIDESKAYELDGGVYNSAEKTITWTEEIGDIDTFVNGAKEISITKEISLVYKDIDVTQTNIENTVTGTISLESPEKEETVEITKEIPAEYLVNISINKIWEDNEIQAQRRPESIIIVLKANGIEEQRYELSKASAETANDTTWTYTFTDLPKYDQYNNIINYTVEEEEKTEGDLKFYTSKIDGTTITNTFTRPTETIRIDVNKNWEDQVNIYKKRPTSIRLEVKQGETVVKSAVVTQDDNWSATFTDLPKYDENGQEIAYTVDEEEVSPNDLFYYEKHIGEVTNKDNILDEKEATITNTMTKIPGTVEVKYVDKNTGDEIADSRIKEGVIGERYDVTEDKKDIEGYTLVEEPAEKTGVYTEEPQEKIYYYAKNTRVIVKYLEQDDTPDDIADNKVLVNEVTIEGYEGQEYTTVEEDIPGYTLVETTDNLEGTMQRDEIVVIYYYAPNTNVIVKYLEQDETPEDNTDNQVLAEEITIEGYAGKEYETEQKTIPNYTFIESTDNTEGTMTKEPIEVIYYYAQNTKVIVKYLEQDETPEDNTDNQVLAEEITIEGYAGLEYKTEQKEIENYTFVESTNNTEGTMTKDVIEVIYYYAQNTKATVQHIDRETGEILKEETKEGKVGDLFETKAEDFEGYVLVESPEEPNIIMDKTGEQIVKYYYAHVSAGVIEKHIDDITGELLYSEEHQGNEGDQYNIPAREFNGYDLVTEDEEGNSRLPENAEGEMKRDEVIEVKYYYIKKAKVIVKYLEEDDTPEDTTDNQVLAEEEIIEGHENDNYETEAKEIEDYNLVETPENAKGTMVITKNPDGTYNTEIEVVYYYKKQAGLVIENHIDITTNETLATEEHQGNIGDAYDIPAREFGGYDLVVEDENGNSMLPTNAKGEMTEEEIVVNYYYIKQAKVKVEYIDKQTGEKLDEEEIQGHIGDEYATEEKEFDGYDLVEKPSNSTGKMTEEEIVVKYYYARKAGVEVKYLEKGTEYEIAPSETIEGYVGDNYETSIKDIPYYNFVESTDNTKGTMEKDKITVIYYYEKQVFNLGIDKWVSSVNVNGISQGARTINNKDEMYVVDIHRSKTETADVKITYTIRVSNKGEIEGTAGTIEEIIPEGYSYHQEDNTTYWEERNGILVTNTLENESIQPGEYKEMEIVLRWNTGEDNFGEKENLVILSGETNPAGYEDIDKEDNYSTSNMMITVATGLDRNGRFIINVALQILIVVAVGLLIIRRRRK